MPTILRAMQMRVTTGKYFFLYKIQRCEVFSERTKGQKGNNTCVCVLVRVCVCVCIVYIF